MPFDWAAFRVGFLDTAKVQKAVDAGKRRVLSRLGAFVRTRARSSIRKRKKPSPPGQPPSSHAGQLRLIFFAWDDSAKSLVVGPIAFQPRGEEAGLVPRLMEQGGETTRRGRRGTRRLHYPARPFMAPALAAEAPKFASQLKNLVR